MCDGLRLGRALIRVSLTLSRTQPEPIPTSTAAPGPSKRYSICSAARVCVSRTIACWRLCLISANCSKIELSPPRRATRGDGAAIYAGAGAYCGTVTGIDDANWCTKAEVVPRFDARTGLTRRGGGEPSRYSHSTLRT